MMSKKDNKKVILAVAILLVLVLGAIIAWFALRPAAPDRHPNAAATEAPAAAAPAKEKAAAPAEGEAAEPVQDAESTPAAAPADEVTIVVLVKHGDGTEKEFTITTESLNLRGALEQEELAQGDESEYGLYVKTVDRETADDGAQEWWCFTKDGEMLMTGVDDTMIADGEHYEIVFTVGW